MYWTKLQFTFSDFSYIKYLKFILKCFFFARILRSSHLTSESVFETHNAIICWGGSPNLYRAPLFCNLYVYATVIHIKKDKHNSSQKLFINLIVLHLQKQWRSRKFLETKNAECFVIWHDANHFLLCEFEMYWFFFLFIWQTA